MFYCSRLAHHYLGHTSSDQISSFGLLTLDRPKLADWSSLPEAWQYELEADSAAIGIVLGASKRSMKDNFVEAALGALLAVTIIGQMDEDVNLGSDTHPPVRLRQENIAATLKAAAGDESRHLESIQIDVANFQRVLYREHGRGLGKLVS